MERAHEIATQRVAFVGSVEDQPAGRASLLDSQFVHDTSSQILSTP